MNSKNSPSMVFIHDWLNGMRGGEKCLEALLELFPSSPIYTLLSEPEKLSDKIRRHKIIPSWIQKMPFAKQKYRYYLPLFPMAIRSLKLEECQAVLSISHCAAKGIEVPKNAKHFCYCLTPMRYLWGFYEEYFEKGPYRWTKFAGLNAMLSMLKNWDLKTAESVDHFIAISKHVSDRIKKAYGRESSIIYPPVDVNKFFYKDDDPLDNYFLMVSALVPYKKVELAIETFNDIGYTLKIIGAGTEYDKLKYIAKPNIEFLGWQPDSALREYYVRARAFIFPGEEDFGITPVEAQACGTPVVAYGRGGALETVIDGQTGIFFQQQTKEALAEAVEKSMRIKYDRQVLRTNALRFRTEAFQNHFKDFLARQGIGL